MPYAYLFDPPHHGFYPILAVPKTQNDAFIGPKSSPNGPSQPTVAG